MEGIMMAKCKELCWQLPQYHMTVYQRNVLLLIYNNKDIYMTVRTQQFCYNLILQGYMFRLLTVIIRPSNEPTQDYSIPSALWDPVTLTVGGVIVL